MTSLEGNFRKTLLLSAASYFEARLSKIVEQFARQNSDIDLLGDLVRNRVISRQYHTWFDWDRSNANKFYQMFGEIYVRHMAQVLSANSTLEESVKAFMEIGRDRNRIVHQDYGTIYVEKTAEEIYSSYKKAVVFVDMVETELTSCATSNRLKRTVAEAS